MKNITNFITSFEVRSPTCNDLSSPSCRDIKKGAKRTVNAPEGISYRIQVKRFPPDINFDITSDCTCWLTEIYHGRVRKINAFGKNMTEIRTRVFFLTVYWYKTLDYTISNNRRTKIEAEYVAKCALRTYAKRIEWQIKLSILLNDFTNADCWRFACDIYYICTFYLFTYGQTYYEHV